MEMRERVLSILDILICLLLIVVPFLQELMDHSLAQWVWYLACAIYFLQLIYNRFHREDIVFETPVFKFISKVGEVCLLPIAGSCFVLNYYDIDRIWMWVIFAMVAIAVPVFFYKLYQFDISHNPRSEEELKIRILSL